MGKIYGPGEYNQGQPLRVGTVNWLLNTVQENSRRGDFDHPATMSKFAIFELTENMSMPDSSRTSGTSSEPDVPWVDNAKMLLYNGATYTYSTRTTDNFNPRLYHPYCFRNSSGIGIGYPPACKGDVVPCILNRQSGRWEIQMPAPNEWRFKLTAILSLNGSATANLVDAAKVADTNVTFTVHDALGIFTGSTDDLGWAKYTTDATAATTIQNEGLWEVRQKGC